ncbi:MAG: recombinase family protein [Endozoicomonas sp.]
MERPALKSLIGDIEEGLIDAVVVYKVDRLTRSLTDFSRVIEIFDQRQVSFASVTYVRDKTCSMMRKSI